MYLAIATRPDIAYIASYLGQFNHCHTEEHGYVKLAPEPSREF